MKGSCAVRITCCAAFSSTGTPRVHIFTGAAFSPASLTEAKRWPRNSYDVVFSGYAMVANLYISIRIPQGRRQGLVKRLLYPLSYGSIDVDPAGFEPATWSLQ